MTIGDIVRQYGVQNIICYIRRSRQDIEREKQTGEDTLKAQDDLMTSILDKISLPYHKESEIKSGESISGRPAFQKVLRWLENDKYEAVAVKEITRLSRGGGADAERIINLLKDHRLIIITPFRVYDPKNPTDMRMIRFELFLSHEEYETTKERMTNARYLFAAQGKWEAGKAPYGYDYDRRKRLLYPNEEQSKVVKMIYDCYLNGINRKKVGLQAIANHISRLGILSPNGNKNWQPVTIRYILTNPLYCGDIYFRTRETLSDGTRIKRPSSEHIIKKDAHEAIIERDIWNKVQIEVKKNATAPHTREKYQLSELAGLCVCSLCGGRMVKRTENQEYYQKRKGKTVTYKKEFLGCQKCGKLKVKYRLVEEAILNYLKMIKELDRAELDNFIKINVQAYNKKQEKNVNSSMLNAIDKKEKELNGRLNFIFDKYEKGIYDDETFIKRKNVITREIEETKMARIETMNTIDTQVIKEISIENVRQNIKYVTDIYNRVKQTKKKNELLRSILSYIVVTITKKGSGARPSSINIFPVINKTLLQ